MYAKSVYKKIYKQILSKYLHLCAFLDSFAFFYFFYTSQPSKMGLGKIRETPNQSSLSLDTNLMEQREVASLIRHFAI